MKTIDFISYDGESVLASLECYNVFLGRHSITVRTRDLKAIETYKDRIEKATYCGIDGIKLYLVEQKAIEIYDDYCVISMNYEDE